MAVETEVKFYLPDVPAIRDRILRLGAASRGRVFETNIRFEDAAGSLFSRKQLLRLRQDRKATLTYKREPAVPDAEYKTYQELETEVSDFETTRRILAALGFHEAQIYEKYRETFYCQDTCLCLDTMPYGHFLEIEGDKNNIRELAGRLQLAWQKRILTNYLNLFEEIKKRHELALCDLTFAGFAALKIDFAPVIESFQAGTNHRQD